MELLLFPLLTFLAALAIQAILLTLTRNRLRPLRWAPLGLLSLPACGVLDAWQTGGFLWELGVLFWAAIALAGLLGWAAAWAVHRHQNKN